MRYQLLVGSGEFWTRAQEDIASAKRRLFVQAMTFEGDVAGLAVAGAIENCAARDRRVLVDDYTRHNLNDTMLRNAGDNPGLMAEAKSTWDMFERLISAGCGVRVTDPLDGKLRRFATRNHKKLLVMDDVAWIGGINFSDHNFEWHDMMIRIEDREVADWLSVEFEADWIGDPDFRQAQFGPELTLMSFDGVSNVQHFGEVLNLFAGARRSIEVLSAYPTLPFTDAFGRAAKRGVEVKLYTPWPNNKPAVRDYLLGIHRKLGIDLRLTPGMTHVKAALIDGEVLVLGSSNFDFVSYRQNNEFVAIIRDAGLIAEVERRLLAPVRAEGVPPTADQLRGWRPLAARFLMPLADQVVARLRPGRRIAEWSRPDS